jgi:[protein-PII] uridylyltransferase
VAARVSVDNQASASCTVVDVRARDCVGLLHTIASALTRAGVEIALAKVSTEGYRAVDSFLRDERRRVRGSAPGTSRLIRGRGR